MPPVDKNLHVTPVPNVNASASNAGLTDPDPTIPDLVEIKSYEAAWRATENRYSITLDFFVDIPLVFLPVDTEAKFTAFLLMLSTGKVLYNRKTGDIVIPY